MRPLCPYDTQSTQPHGRNECFLPLVLACQVTHNDEGIVLERSPQYLFCPKCGYTEALMPARRKT